MIIILMYVFVFIFFFNLIPAFAPPTWIILTYIEYQYHPNVIVLGIIGAVAATLGRLLLARLASVIVRDRFLSESSIRNIDALKDKLYKHKRITAGLFLFYAFSPLPSNQLFLAYGLTNLPVRFVALPFFIGRLVSYAFWIGTTAHLSNRLSAGNFDLKNIFTGYFIVIQILTLLSVYLFAKIDWNILFTKHKITFLKNK